MDGASITFGQGALREVGDLATTFGMKRVGLFTDGHLANSEHVSIVTASLASSGVESLVYSDVQVEPTDQSFKKAAQWAQDVEPDGFVSVGGGSVIDTTKAANLYSCYPADFLTYVNRPIGAGEPVPGLLKPHIACPTTSGTGSECTGIAVFDLLDMRTKTGIASKRLRPSHAVVDPTVAATLPANVVASSGFDVLSHALESYTARRYLERPAPQRPSDRPASQGSNPWSDMGCRESLRLLGRYLVRAVHDATDTEARYQVMWAATLAGIAFGNAGCHAPHGMSYSVSGLVKDFQPPGYPLDRPLIPHGMSVVVNAPAVFRQTWETNPERHAVAARWLGASPTNDNATPHNEVLSGRIIDLMKATGMPNGLRGLGFAPEDIPSLVDGSVVQRRLMDNAPVVVDTVLLTSLFTDSLTLW